MIILNLGENIKKYRKKSNLTQQELAKKSNISRSYLADVEKNRYNPSLDTLIKIADALEVPLDYLTGESVKSIIEDRLSELNMTIEQLSEKTRVPMTFLNNLDNLTTENEEDYRSLNLSLNRISNVLEIHPNKLRTALARQEPPAYDSPTSSAIDDFGGENSIKEDSAEYMAKIPKEFTDSAKARAFVNSFVIFGSNGFDSNKLDDDEILKFANELLAHMDTVKYKYKK